MKTTWSLNEPNIASALDKNSKNICAMNKCQKELEKQPHYGYGGLKVCKECHEKYVMPMLEQIKKEDNEYIFGILNGLKK